MKASKFSDAQKAFIIKQGDDGVPVADICRKAGISQATYFNWRKKYQGLLPDEIRRLRALEEENGRLKKIVADLTLDREMLQDVIRRKLSACPKAQAGRRDVGGVGRIDPEGLPGFEVRHIHLPLQNPSPRAGRSRRSHQGDLRDARAVWLPPRACLAVPGRMGNQHEEDASSLQRIRPATAQQASKAAGEGEAARRSPGGVWTERCLGDGLRPRPTRYRKEAAHPNHRRHALALLPCSRPAVRLSRRRRGSDARTGLQADRLSEDDTRRQR